MKTLRSKHLKSGGLAALVFCLATLFTLQAKAQQSDRSALNATRETDQSATAEHPASAQPSALQTGAPSHQTGSKLQLASDETKDRTDRKLAGHQVRSRDGKDLGNVKDFLVNPKTGEVVFGLVSSGGMGKVGDKLRLVPFKALQPGSKKGEFSVMLDKAGWEKVALVKEDELKTGRFTLADDRRRALTAHFAGSETGASPTSFYTEGISAQLVCASELRDKNVRSGTKEIGSIEGLVIDPTAGTATALFDPKMDLAHGRRKFLVPLSQLALGASKREPVTTTLSTADFEHAFSANTMASRTSVAQPAQIVSPTPGPDRKTTAVAAQNSANESGAQRGTSVAAQEKAAAAAIDESSSAASRSTAAKEQVATRSPTRESKDENLTPTGQTSADQLPKGAEGGLITAARAVRKSLDEDDALARADVTVTPENGKLVLRGTVASEEIKGSVEKKAKAAVHAIGIQNELKVQSK